MDERSNLFDFGQLRKLLKRGQIYPAVSQLEHRRTVGCVRARYARGGNFCTCGELLKQKSLSLFAERANGLGSASLTLTS